MDDCYGHPDPKTLPEQFHPGTEFLEFAIPWGVFALLLIHRLSSPKSKLLVSSISVPIGWLVPIMLLWIDSGGSFEWITHGK